MSLNVFTFDGHLTQDVKFTVVGEMSIAEFTVAVNGMKDDETIFVPVVAFKKKGESARDWLCKGRQVMVSGKVKPTSWTSKKDGTTHKYFKVVADYIGFVKEFGKVPVRDPLAPEGEDEEPKPLGTAKAEEKVAITINEDDLPF